MSFFSCLDLAFLVELAIVGDWHHSRSYVFVHTTSAVHHPVLIRNDAIPNGTAFSFLTLSLSAGCIGARGCTGSDVGGVSLRTAENRGVLLQAGDIGMLNAPACLCRCSLNECIGGTEKGARFFLELLSVSLSACSISLVSCCCVACLVVTIKRCKVFCSGLSGDYGLLRSSASVPNPFVFCPYLACGFCLPNRRRPWIFPSSTSS